MAGKAAFQTILIRAGSLALIMFLFLAGLCEREEEKEFVEVMLEIPFTITPPDKAIERGDTLWIEAFFPDTVHDYIGKKYYKVPNYDFFTSIVLTKLVSKSLFESQQPAAGAAFDFHFHTGTITDIGSLGGKLKFEYNGANYRIKFGLIPKFTGVFSFRMIFREYDTNNVVPITEDPSTARKNRVFVMYRMNYILNNGNFHYELYDSLVKHNMNPDEPDFDRLFNVYCFKVK